MAFVRTKKVGKYRYFYLVQNKRIDGKIKQETLVFLRHWPTVKEAIQGMREEAQYCRERYEHFKAKGWYKEYKGKRIPTYWLKVAEDYLRQAEEAEQRVNYLLQYM